MDKEKILKEVSEMRNVISADIDIGTYNYAFWATRKFDEGTDDKVDQFIEIFKNNIDGDMLDFTISVRFDGQNDEVRIEIKGVFEEMV
jgi:effector-binding domain-containing protein